jgi:hypothetical protein
MTGTSTRSLLLELELHLRTALVPSVDDSWLPIVHEIIQSARRAPIQPTDMVQSPNDVPVKVTQVIRFFKLEKFIHSA